MWKMRGAKEIVKLRWTYPIILVVSIDIMPHDPPVQSTLEVAQVNNAAGTVLHFGFASGLRRSRAVEPAIGPVK
jgi:hypothetical protein